MRRHPHSRPRESSNGPRPARIVLMLLALALAAPAALAQYENWGWEAYDYEPPRRDIFPGNAFTFCRIQYTSGDDGDFGGGRRRGRRGGGGGNWRTDYPESDLNFSRRLAERTTIAVNTTADDRIKHDIVRLDEPDLFNYPFIYMLEVESMALTDPERDGLRSYLLRGGFLMVDDFWGQRAWENLAFEMAQVLPPEEYPFVDVPLTHEIFHIVYDIKEVPQIPSFNNYNLWLRTGITYEQRWDYGGDTSAHCRGIFDKHGRLMVVAMHNSDLGDGWEREGVGIGYFRDFSVKKAYPMGINIVVYAMTH
jgi:hypothetical protein